MLPGMLHEVVRRGVLQYAPTFANSHKGMIGLCATTNLCARGKSWAGVKKKTVSGFSHSPWLLNLLDPCRWILSIL